MAGRTSTSYAADKGRLLQRLKRIEGPARGLQRMVEDDRYRLDIIQQIYVLTAAARDVSLLVLEDHVRGRIADAVTRDDVDAAIMEMVAVLGKALRL